MVIASNSNLFRKITIIFVLLIVNSVAAARTIHVKAGGTGDGSSWANAYGSLQDALDDAEPNDSIWVAEGTYTPTNEVGGTGDKYKTFQMINHVGIYGGFSATGEPGWEDRDWEKYETVLSGDMLGNDVEVGDPCDLIGEPSRADNCYHVFYHPNDTNLDANAVLDGFTITGGNATGGPWPDPNERGGGMYNDNSSPTVINCAFQGNMSWIGGGMYNGNDSNPRVLNCTFTGNTEDGMDNSESSPVITSCTFHNNADRGMRNYKRSPTIANCTFSDNSSGGMRNGDGNPTVIDCIFRNNGKKALEGGGMLNFGLMSRPKIIRCVFIDNVAWYFGGGMHNDGSSPTITDCIFIHNRANSYPPYASCGGGIHTCCGGKLTVKNCVFAANSAIYGGGMFTVSGSPGSHVVTNCTFFHNNASSAGGGGMYFANNNTTVTNCIFWGNGWKQIEAVSSAGNVAYCDVMGGFPGVGNIDTDPCFADPGYWDPNSTPDYYNDDFWVPGDYHIKSQGGRYDPTIHSWFYDDVASPCIDAGNPLSPIGEEPFPNGGIINMGAYGGTEEASKSYFGKPPCEVIVAGDVNGDCLINFLDFRLMALHWCEDNNP